MTEAQPDMLGGKTVPGSRLRRIRRTGKAPIARTGWADKPGTGPQGETCGSCTYCEAFHFRKRYHKCAARDGDHWKGGRATDIRPLDPACSKWAPSVNRANQQRAASHEVDRLADVAPGSPDARARREDPAIEPGGRDHTSRSAGALAHSGPEQAAPRPRAVTRRPAEEGLQRAFEF